MRALILPLKNVFVKWWRSLTLGFFILVIGLCMVLFSSFTRAVVRNGETAVVNSVTGHIEIRSDRSREFDMVAQYNQGWDALEPIPAGTVGAVKDAIQQALPSSTLHELVRQNVSLRSGNQKEDVMLMGRERDSTEYQKSFTLTKGRYLQPDASHEVLITAELADRFSLDVGSHVTIVTKNRYGLNARAELTVSGIGNFLVLSLFSYSAAYTDIATMRELIALGPGEATDVVVYANGLSQYEGKAQELVSALSRTGLNASLTKGMLVKSRDLSMQSISEIKNEWDKPAGVSVSTYTEMGRVYQGVGTITSAALSLFIVFLFIIIFIMIMNLVFMMGLERFREIGTLRAIGISRGRILGLFLGEIALVAGLFAILGIGAGALIVLSVGGGIESPFAFLDFIMGKTISLALDVPYCGAVFLIIVGFALAASLYPAYRACTVRPAQALRTV